jgi:ferredoxin
MQQTNPSAREAALRVRDAFDVKPSSLVSYNSAGLVAVIADLDSWKMLGELPDPLRAIGVINSEPSSVKGLANVVAQSDRSLILKGHLGAFELTLEDASGRKESLRADIVLDLGAEPLSRIDLPPPGYLHARLDEQPVTDLYEQLSDMTGEFDKPRFFKYQADLCAHSANGATVCTRCIDACPAEAISSIGERIEVDPFLCQGGGVCASVCPAGAIQYVYPHVNDQGNRVRVMLKAYREYGGEQARVVFHCVDDDPEEILGAGYDLLPVEVEEIASVGMELCLSTLVYGAAQVVLLVGHDVPEQSLRALRHQLEWLHSVMLGLGLHTGQVRLQRVSEALAATNLDDFPYIEAALYSMPENKRQALYQAVDHLYASQPRTREMVNLPTGAPFGSASIDASACTLCMACVGACPGRALQDGSNREVPELFFIESNCLQCGACTLTCPENAISISPRLVFDREKRNLSRMLHQDEPFACIACGKPFAPSSVIHKMTHRLQGHHMFQSARALDRLKMCENCRVADIVQDAEAMDGQFDPMESIASKLLP